MRTDKLSGLGQRICYSNAYSQGLISDRVTIEKRRKKTVGRTFSFRLVVARTLCEGHARCVVQDTGQFAFLDRAPPKTRKEKREANHIAHSPAFAMPTDRNCRCFGDFFFVCAFIVIRCGWTMREKANEERKKRRRKKTVRSYLTGSFRVDVDRRVRSSHILDTVLFEIARVHPKRITHFRLFYRKNVRTTNRRLISQ